MYFCEKQIKTNESNNNKHDFEDKNDDDGQLCVENMR